VAVEDDADDDDGEAGEALDEALDDAHDQPDDYVTIVPSVPCKKNMSVSMCAVDLFKWPGSVQKLAVYRKSRGVQKSSHHSGSSMKS